MKKVTGIILLAGSSSRYNKGKNKNLETINDSLVINYSIKKFLNNKYINDLILVIREEDIENVLLDLDYNFDVNKEIKLILGGETRQKSVYNALKVVDSDIVIIHDGARPLIKDNYINKCIESMDEYQASTIAVKSKDTIKISNDNNEVISTTNRDNTWIIQTPQCFNTKILKEAHEKHKNELVTDDCSLVEKDGIKVKLLEGDYTNIKITTPEDIDIVKKILRK